MHNNAVVWCVKDVCNPRTHIREEAYWIPNEIGGTENAVQLPQDVLTVVVCDTTLELRYCQSHICDGESVELKRCVIDIPQCHCQRVDYHCQGVPNAQPAST